MSIGRVIRSYRKKMGWTQEKLAQKLRISRVTLGKYERDEQILDFDVFLKLLDIFQMSADSFLKRNMKKTANDLEERFLRELRKEEDLYWQVMKYPKIEIQKLKNLY